MKKTTEEMLSTFVKRTIMSKKLLFKEEDIVYATQKAFYLSATEKKVMKQIVKDSINKFLDSNIIKKQLINGTAYYEVVK